MREYRSLGSGVELDLCGSAVAGLVRACESLERLANIWYFMVKKEKQPNMREFKEAQTIMEGI